MTGDPGMIRTIKLEFMDKEMNEAAELALNGFGNPGELPVSVLSDIRKDFTKN